MQIVYCVNPVNSHLIVSKSSQCVLEGLEPLSSWLEELQKTSATDRFQQSYSRGVSCCVQKEVSKGLTLKM